MARKPRGDPVNGWIALDKPLEMTSTEAVARIKRLFNAQKAGHAGTLDPLATGILPIALGEATKTVAFLMEADKAYRFTLRWGVSTDSQDLEGRVIARSDIRPGPEAIASMLAGFVGEIDQVPPQFSAVRVEGERAYDLARGGMRVELAPRRVRLHAARLLDGADPETSTFEIRSGKGFYVRALVRDLAAALGAEAVVTSLRRTMVGQFTADVSISLDSLAAIEDKARLRERLLPIETALDDIPALAITAEDASKLRQGRALVLLPHQMEEIRPHFRPRQAADWDATRAVLAMWRGRAIALGEARAGKFSPVRVFHNDEEC